MNDPASTESARSERAHTSVAVPLANDMLRLLLLVVVHCAAAAAANPGILSPARVTRAALGVASQGMGLIKPIFGLEAKLQAQVLGSDSDRAAAQSRLAADTTAPVVVYTYALSPFSTECIKFLDETGCTYKKIELGLEWFALGGEGSCLRAELLERTGMSSLPHVFIGGESVGGLYSGSPGLVALKKSGKLVPMLRKAGAL